MFVKIIIAIIILCHGGFVALYAIQHVIFTRTRLLQASIVTEQENASVRKETRSQGTGMLLL